MEEQKTVEKTSTSNPHILPLSIILASLIVSASILMVGGNFQALNQNPTGMIAGPSAPAEPVPAEPAAVQPTPSAVPSGPVDLSGISGHWKGSPDAPVSIVEFSEFECPYCSRFYNDAHKQIIKQYVDTGKARIAFAHFPLSFHSNARPAANAAECAGEQGKFFEMHDKMFENQSALSDASYAQWAEELGLDTTQFSECYSSTKYDNVVSSDFQIGQSVGVSGTPTVFVNGQKIVGAQPFSAFETAIEAALAP
ncbi:thioredoxin domain-containing protein [Candidatus Micrarchaeota archaeon]|nr:thioredoxin domain-containing protein [Candidatus Micrarchaeota archaeon]MBU1930452.1 thioredoxin domain-containing protein [Candidatus Micrarchaeota archaeon]